MAERSITPYGRRWEWWHSLWIGWALLTVGMFSWASFLYAGLRGRGRSWLLWAAAYATPWVPLIVFTEDKPGWDGLDYAFLYLTIVWLVSSVHAFLIRPEYLRRIASRRIEQRGEPIARTAPGSGHVARRTRRPPAGTRTRAVARVSVGGTAGRGPLTRPRRRHRLPHPHSSPSCRPAMRITGRL